MFANQHSELHKVHELFSSLNSEVHVRGIFIDTKVDDLESQISRKPTGHLLTEDINSPSIAL